MYFNGKKKSPIDFQIQFVSDPKSVLYNSLCKQIWSHLIPSIKLLTYCIPNLLMLIHKDEIH